MTNPQTGLQTGAVYTVFPAPYPPLPPLPPPVDVLVNAKRRDWSGLLNIFTEAAMQLGAHYLANKLASPRIEITQNSRYPR